MKTDELLKGVRIKKGYRFINVNVAGISSDTRTLEKNFCYVAFKGSKFDGKEFIKEAIEKGAVLIVSELVPDIEMNIPWIQVEDARSTLSLMASNFYGNPSNDFSLIGVTGTEGKTSTCFLLESIIKETGFKCGLIGTVFYRYNGVEIKSNLTTPDPVQLQQMFMEMKKNAVNAVAMEVSSHSLDQKRVEGCNFDVACFMGIQREHLDYHQTFEAYFESKKLLFTHYLAKSMKRKGAVLNIDDPMIKRFAKTKFNVRKLTFSMRKGGGDIFPIFFECTKKGIRAELSIDGQIVEVRSKLLGEHNLINIMAAIGATYFIGINPETSVKGIEKLKTIPGRLQKVETGRDFDVIIDYCHTPYSIEKAISAMRPFTRGNLIVIMGAGGDRDQGKRFFMGQAAYKGADVIFVTSDNPRTEDPKKIIEDIMSGINELKKEGGLKPVHVIEDRRKAICQAIKDAKTGDCVLICGKGHEDYQIIGTKKIHFNDAEVVMEYIRDGGREK